MMMKNRMGLFRPTMGRSDSTIMELSIYSASSSSSDDDDDEEEEWSEWEDPLWVKDDNLKKPAFKRRKSLRKKSTLARSTKLVSLAAATMNADPQTGIPAIPSFPGLSNLSSSSSEGNESGASSPGTSSFVPLTISRSLSTSTTASSAMSISAEDEWIIDSQATEVPDEQPQDENDSKADDDKEKASEPVEQEEEEKRVKEQEEQDSNWDSDPGEDSEEEEEKGIEYLLKKYYSSPEKKTDIPDDQTSSNPDDHAIKQEETRRKKKKKTKGKDKGKKDSKDKESKGKHKKKKVRSDLEESGQLNLTSTKSTLKIVMPPLEISGKVKLQEEEQIRPHSSRKERRGRSSSSRSERETRMPMSARACYTRRSMRDLGVLLRCRSREDVTDDKPPSPSSSSSSASSRSNPNSPAQVRRRSRSTGGESPGRQRDLESSGPVLPRTSPRNKRSRIIRNVDPTTPRGDGRESSDSRTILPKLSLSMSSTPLPRQGRSNSNADVINADSAPPTATPRKGSLILSKTSSFRLWATRRLSVGDVHKKDLISSEDSAKQTSQPELSSEQSLHYILSASTSSILSSAGSAVSTAATPEDVMGRGRSSSFKAAGLFKRNDATRARRERKGKHRDRSATADESTLLARIREEKEKEKKAKGAILLSSTPAAGSSSPSTSRRPAIAIVPQPTSPQGSPRSASSCFAPESLIQASPLASSSSSTSRLGSSASSTKKKSWRDLKSYFHNASSSGDREAVSSKAIKDEARSSKSPATST